ncbi:stage V sporulation protein AA [Cohnella sp. GCM10012308]|uniref:stage V sporulation protein AA n=1 Tax=Cohnella sp. GCM10012308 TaxID=3317329 RepID=UPI00361DE7AC
MRRLKAGTVYLRLRRRVDVRPGAVVKLGDIASIETDRRYEDRIQELIVWKMRPEDGNLLMIDMLQIVRLIRRFDPDLTVETFGEPHVLLETTPEGKVKPRYTLLVAAWLLLFFGSGMAIMNFHADVDMPVVQRRIIELLTGRPDRHALLFEIPYSLGVGLGMLIFFNRVFRKRLNDEPNPLEVEMFMYQENVNHYVITEEYAKAREREAGPDA